MLGPETLDYLVDHSTRHSASVDILLNIIQVSLQYIHKSESCLILLRSWPISNISKNPSLSSPATHFSPLVQKKTLSRLSNAPTHSRSSIISSREFGTTSKTCQKTFHDPTSIGSNLPCLTSWRLWHSPMRNLDGMQNV